MRKGLWLSGVTTLMLLAACSSTPLSPELSTQANSVPFKASVSGTLESIVETVFGLEGDGNRLLASHLGQIGYRAQGTFTGPYTVVLIETLTAANGDTLTIRCDQTLEEISPNVFRWTDTWTVIGGTGRFEGATGYGTSETHADPDSGTFSKELTGTISY